MNITTMTLPFDLNLFLQQISGQIGFVGNYTVNRPADAAHLNALPRAELRAASARYRMNVVRRMAGKVFEFTRRAA